ncbi:hypothetical protein F4824DRAFT_330161, partial [Ustulina deusta]
CILIILLGTDILLLVLHDGPSDLIHGGSFPNGRRFSGDFGDSKTNLILRSTGYVSALLYVNLPQIFVSIYYYYFSAFYTHLQVQHEWNEYSTKCKPLRVSYPKGHQISSYRLQLPYKYSIPLMLGSAVCHWLVSNTIFLFIKEGGFAETNLFGWGSWDPLAAERLFGVSGPSLIAIGYSPPATLALLIVVFLLFPLPFFFSQTKVKGAMVNGGTNSLVISAACHSYISPRERNQQPSTFFPEDGTQHIPNSRRTTEEDLRSTTNDKIDDLKERLRKLAQSPLKWGTMPIPGHVHDTADSEDMEGVLHLGFGDEATVEDHPKEGQRYI